MQVTSGVRLGPYEISSRIGAGGMGEVWAAKDRRLNRDVAVKVLPEAVARDADRLHRFEQEARAAGAISHPNLVTIFDVGEENGTAYVVMELLAGETLRDKIGEAISHEGGPRLPIRKAIDYASQIASGLSAAHDKGIIHRDLKPENVFITQDGRLKILDFGLAKLTARDEPQDGADDRTQERGTSPGTVVGTAGYMSPEQVRGHQVDHRTDIFSLGAVLYEMLAGRRAFRRESAVETMSAILKEDPPDLQDVKTPVAPGLERIVRRCLEKAPGERFQSAHDIAFALDAVSSTSSQQAIVEIPSAKRRMQTIAAIAGGMLLACVLTGLVVWRAARRGTAVVAAAADAPRRSFAQLTYDGNEVMPSLSPDGKTFVFVSAAAGREDIYLQRVDGRNAINLTKDAPASSTHPAFSPDGEQIAFRSDRDGGGIFLMGATGESVHRLSSIGFNPSWSPDGKELAVGTDSINNNPRGRTGRSELRVIDAHTGATRVLLAEDAAQPAWSPHGSRIAYWSVVGDGGQRDLFTIDPHAPNPAKSVVRLTSDPYLDWSPAWSPDGKWLYFGSERDGTLNLWRMAMDEQSGKATSPPEPVTLPARFAGHFTVARNTGDLAFDTSEQSETIWSVPFDPAGIRVTGEPVRIRRGALLTFDTPEPSPDGQSWVFSNSGAQEDLYLMKADGTGLRQLTNDPEKDRGPSFSADGKLIYFYSQRGPRYEIHSIRPDGSDLKKVSTLTGRPVWYPTPIPRRNALVAFNEMGAQILPFDTGGTITRSEPLAAMSEPGAHLSRPRVSSDGTMLVGQVLSVPSMRGVWTYSLVTKQYQKISDSLETPRWVPNSTRYVVVPSKRGITVIDTTTKGAREIRLPIESVSLLNFTPDGKTLQLTERTEQSSIWLMKSRTGSGG